jgi:hypothetical protein
MYKLIKTSFILIALIFSQEIFSRDAVLLAQPGAGVYDLGKFGNAELSLVSYEEYRARINFLKYSREIEIDLSNVKHRKKINEGNASLVKSPNDDLVFLIFNCRTNSKKFAAAQIRVNDLLQSINMEKFVNDC